VCKRTGSSAFRVLTSHFTLSFSVFYSFYIVSTIANSFPFLPTTFLRQVLTLKITGFLNLGPRVVVNLFFSFWRYSPIQALAASMKLSVSLQLLDLGQSVGLLGRMISSSRGLYLHTNTKHPWLGRDSNPRSRRRSERRQFMP
jgi:hypothetical protein